VDTSLQLSIGALVALGAIATGYGMLRGSVTQNAKEILSLETRIFSAERDIREIQLWIERRKGESNAKRNGSISDTAASQR